MAINEATDEEGVKEVVAKDLEAFPLFFGLCVSGDIVKQVPERKKNKSKSNRFCVFYLFGMSGVYILGL